MSSFHPRVTLSAIAATIASAATALAASSIPLHSLFGSHADAIAEIASIVSVLGAVIVALGQNLPPPPAVATASGSLLPAEAPVPSTAGKPGKEHPMSTTTTAPASSLLQDLQIVEQVGVAITGDVEAFAAGSSVSIPPIPLSSNANGKTELVISVQKASAENPFSLGSLTSTLGGLFIDLLSGAPIALPPFTEKIGSTIISISASIQRVPTAAAAPAQAAAA